MSQPRRRPASLAWTFACLAGLAASPSGAAPNAGGAAAKRIAVYVGTYTIGSQSKGIYRFTLDAASGRLTPDGEPTPAANPSFLAFHPSGRFLYAVNELKEFEGKPSGAVSAFTLDPLTGALSPLNQQPSLGPGPCHLSLDAVGSNLLVANYDGGSVAVLPVNADGRLGPASAFVQHKGSSVDPARQQGPHAHSVNLDSANRFALVADLGLDKVLVYRFDGTSGTLAPHQPPFAVLAPGAGPRHLAFRRGGAEAYVLGEMKSTITALAYDASAGRLKELQTLSTLPVGFEGANSAAEIAVSPDGQFLYSSNRGHDSLAIFAIDPATGKLTTIGHQSTFGKTPRNFAIDPPGDYLLVANQNSDSIVVFRIDHATGRLAPVGEPLAVPRPVCVRMRPLPD